MSCKKDRLRLPALVAWALVLAASSPAGAEEEPEPEEPPVEEEGWEPILLPIVGGSSDIGVLVGVQAAVARLEPGYDPYRWKGDFAVAMSFKEGPETVELPVHYYAVTFDLPGLAGGGLRLSPRAEYRKIINTGYYGLGNASELTDAPEGASSTEAFRRNQFVHSFAGARLNALVALPRDFGVLTGLRFRYMMPGVYGGSRLEEDSAPAASGAAPLVVGTDRHAILGFMLGVAFDNRDSESNPERGMHHQLFVRFSPGAAGGTDYNFGSLTTHLRFFWPWVGEYLVLASRLRSDLYFGDAPFHDLELGMIRGVPSRRYHGKVKLLGNLELRSVFLRFKLKKQRLGLGAAAFVDSGRVFAGYEHDEELDGHEVGLKWGVGGGFRILWGKTRVARFDVAYSPDKAAASPDLPVAFYLHINHFF